MRRTPSLTILPSGAPLGADVTINYKATPDWAGAVHKAIGDRKVANVIDTVGATQFDENASLLTGDGQISAIGMRSPVDENT